MSTSGRHSRFPAINRDPKDYPRQTVSKSGTPEPQVEPNISDPDAGRAAAAEAAEQAAVAEAAVVDSTPASYSSDWTIDEVIEWVSDDEGRAAVALRKENEREKPRKGVLSALGVDNDN